MGTYAWYLIASKLIDELLTEASATNDTAQALYLTQLAEQTITWM